MDPPYLYLRGGQSPPACPTSRWVHACAEGIALVHLCRSPSPGRSWESLPKATRKEEGDGPRCVPPGVQHCVLARCSHQTSRGTHQGQSMLRSRLEQRMGTSRYLPLTQFVPNQRSVSSLWVQTCTSGNYRRWYGPGTAVDIIARCSHRAARRHAENPYVPLTQFVPNLQWLPAVALPPLVRPRDSSRQHRVLCMPPCCKSLPRAGLGSHCRRQRGRTRAMAHAVYPRVCSTASRPVAPTKHPEVPIRVNQC